MMKDEAFLIFTLLPKMNVRFLLIFLSLFPLLRLEAQTTFEWGAINTGAGSVSEPSSLVSDSSNSIYVSGSFENNVDLDPGNSQFRFFANNFSDDYIQKLDSNGNFVWGAHLNSPSGISRGQIISVSHHSLFASIRCTDSVEIDFKSKSYTLYSTSTNGSSTFLAKFNLDGDLIWSKEFRPTNGLGRIVKIAGIEEKGNNLIIAGDFTGAVDFDLSNAANNIMTAQGRDCFITQIDTAGNFVWAKKFGGPNSDQIESLSISPNGNVSVCGTFNGIADFDPDTANFNLNAGTFDDVFIAQYSPFGFFRFAKQIEGNNLIHVTSIVTDEHANLYILGQYRDSVNFNPGQGTNIKYVAAYDIYLLKLDYNGTYEWVKTIGGNFAEVPYDLALSADGNIILSGQFTNTADLHPDSSITLNYTATGIKDGFVEKIDTLGNLVWIQKPDGSNLDEVSIIDVSDEFIFGTGSFRGSISLDPNSSNRNFQSRNKDAFIFKWKDMISVSISDIEEKKKAVFYPNPVKNLLNVKLENKNFTDAAIYNSVGQIVEEFSIKEQDMIRITLNLSSGTYLLQLSNSRSFEVIKFIVK